MGNCFKKQKLHPVENVDPLQEIIPILEKRKTHLYKLIEIQQQKANESKTDDQRDGYLRQKVTYETELEKLLKILVAS